MKRFGPHQPGPVDEGLYLRCHIGKIGGRPQQNAVRLYHLFQHAVKIILSAGTPLVLFFKTLVTGKAPPYFLAGQGDKLRVYTFSLKLLQNIL